MPARAAPYPCPICAYVPPAGASYYDFIASMGLPSQLAEVDPIVASFCGGAVSELPLQGVVFWAAAERARQLQLRQQQ